MLMTSNSISYNPDAAVDVAAKNSSNGLNGIYETEAHSRQGDTIGGWYS